MVVADGSLLGGNPLSGQHDSSGPTKRSIIGSQSGLLGAAGKLGIFRHEA